ncbi:hypothetical protein ACFWD7_53280 [Streptomyces mirabilis]|uniref:hypothetical protein n=1 Tax=Streptomyces mirabilis TaxID=68239 RepID=UPI00369E813C
MPHSSSRASPISSSATDASGRASSIRSAARFDYAVAVPASHRVTTPAGRFDTAGVLAKLPRRAWQRIRTGHGTKGERHYDWVMIEVTADDIPPRHETGHSFLLVRRHRYTRELSFYRFHSTTPVTLSDLVEVICCRWRVEEFPGREVPGRARSRADDLLELLDALEPDQPHRPCPSHRGRRPAPRRHRKR